MGTRTPRELIEIYWDEVYNNCRTELIREVCADPIIRHDAGSITPLSHDEQIERVERSLRIKPYFTHRVLHADDRFVTSVWNMDSMQGNGVKLCGIEVFEAHDGRFTRCWNSTYMKGFWGEDGDEFDPSRLTAPPLLETTGEITAQWMERALAAGGAVMPQRIAIEPIVEPIGHGTSGTTAQVHMGYNVGTVTAPTDVIAKFGRTKGVSPGRSPGERELLAYRLLGNQAPFRKPRLWFGAHDETGLTNLVLEDLSDRARPGDQIAGCSIAEAGAVVRELAAFHAAWWDNEAGSRERVADRPPRHAATLRSWRGQDRTVAGKPHRRSGSRAGRYVSRQGKGLACYRAVTSHADPFGPARGQRDVRRYR